MDVCTIALLIMFGLIKKCFIGLLTGLLNGSNYTKWLSLSNQKCMIQPTLINLHLNKYSQEFYCYSLVVKLDNCVGNINTSKKKWTLRILIGTIFIIYKV